MWVYIAIGVLLLYALYKERQALGCPSIPNGEDCDNRNGKAVKGSTPTPYDSNQTLCSKLRRAGSFKDRFVFWRVAIMVSFVCAMLSWFILYQRVPSEWELVVLMLVISSILYFTDSFYKFHLSDHVNQNIQQTVNVLQERGFCGT